MDEQPKTLRDGIRVGIPFGIAAGLVGISFGVVAEPIMGAGPAIAMSAFVFAGAAQFGATAVLASGGSTLAAILAGIMLNARFLPMGIAVAGALRGGPLARALQGQAVVDASWAAAHVGGGRFDRNLLIGATIPQYPAWVLGTVIGALGAGALGDPKALGLDAVFPAFFLGLLLSEATASRLARIVAITGASIALALTPLLPPGLPILAASGAALLGLWRR
ncbi:MAG TPA: AzlC family ABC transporter permease [Thermoleophilaceae bacterium]|nr:AzlC family ABC transporter permease [Thermoleophilaceae bacterium]